MKNFFWPLIGLFPFIMVAQPAYRSNGSGYFSHPSNWQYSLDGTTWGTPAAPPSANTASQISILDGDTLLIDNTLSIDQIRVEAGGILILDGSAATLQNGAGTDMQVEGTLIDRSTATASWTFASGATWRLGSAGKIVKTHNSSIAIYRDGYEGGISQIPATAHWVYCYEGKGMPAVVTIDMYYPNLTFENAAGGVFTPPSNLGIFRGGSTNCIIKGNLDIGGTQYAGGYVMYNNNFNAVPIQVLGHVYVRSGSVFSNEKVLSGGSSTLREGTGLEVKGNLNIEGVLIIRKTDQGISGENTQPRMLTLSGSQPQWVKGGGSMSIDALVTNNASGITLDKPVQALRNLTMQAGNIFATQGFTLGEASAAGLQGTLIRNSGLIVGSFTRYIASSDTNALFPLGNSLLDDRILHFSWANGQAGTLSAFFGGTPNMQGLPLTTEQAGTPFAVVASDPTGFWQISSSGLTATTLQAQAFPKGIWATALGDRLTLLQRQDGNWQAQGVHALSGTALSPIVKRTVLSSWNSLLLTAGAESPAPIQLEQWEWVHENGTSSLRWQCSMPQIISFHVEYAAEGHNFTFLKAVEAVGGSYQFEWPALTGYVRLAMLDAEQHKTYSHALWVEGDYRLYVNSTAWQIYGVATAGMAQLYDTKGQLLGSFQGGQSSMNEWLRAQQEPSGHGWHLLRYADANGKLHTFKLFR